MKKTVFWSISIGALLIIAFSIFFNLYCLRIDSKISSLEATVNPKKNYKLNFNLEKPTLESLSNEVAKLNENKNFITDAYSTNLGWASLVLTLLVAGAFAIMALNIIVNSKRVDEIKDEFSKLLKSNIDEISKKSLEIEKEQYNFQSNFYMSICESKLEAKEYISSAKYCVVAIHYSIKTSLIFKEDISKNKLFDYTVTSFYNILISPNFNSNTSKAELEDLTTYFDSYFDKYKKDDSIYSKLSNSRNKLSKITTQDID